MYWQFLVAGLILIGFQQSIAGRDGKVFSLFNIVQFKNDLCDTLTSGKNGTCYTSTECTNKGGQASGNCAAGFGVCCYFAVSSSGSSLNENNSYIQNPGYPSTYSSSSTLSYTINKCSDDICMLRLDMETFSIKALADTNENTACIDSLVITSTNSQSIPTICGKNAGQHIYIDLGTPSTNTATLTFTFATTSTITTDRTWDIRVAQIPCSANYAPPSGCLQYHTGLTGSFQTFNFLETTTKAHLPSQE